MKWSYSGGTEKHKKPEELKCFMSTLPKVTAFFTTLASLSTYNNTKVIKEQHEAGKSASSVSSANTLHEVEKLPVAGN